MFVSFKKNFNGFLLYLKLFIYSSLYFVQVPEPEEEFVTPLRERLGLDKTTKGQSALMIRDSLRVDHGNYTIRVENTHGVAFATCYVNVLGKDICIAI